MEATMIGKRKGYVYVRIVRPKKRKNKVIIRRRPKWLVVKKMLWVQS